MRQMGEGGHQAVRADHREAIRMGMSGSRFKNRKLIKYFSMCFVVNMFFFLFSLFISYYYVVTLYLCNVTKKNKHTKHNALLNCNQSESESEELFGGDSR